MKLVIKLVIGVVVVVLLAVLAVFFFLDSIARSAIEEGATYALGVRTTLEKADVGVLSGRFSLAGLDVSNPEGFDAPNFLSLGAGTVEVSLGTLRSDTVELPLLALSDIDLALEKKSAGSNYGVIAQNLKRFESADEPQTPDPQKQEGPGKDFVIHEILITNVNVTAEMAATGGQLNQVRVPISEIRLENVGTGADQRVTMGELSNIIMKAILAAIIANGADFPAELVNDLGGQLQGLASLDEMGITQSIGAAKGISDSIERLGDAKTAEDVGKGIDEINKQIEGLGDLLGGKKKDG